MAAGLGTRLLPYTKFLPKPFLPLMGIPVMQYAIDQVAKAGVKEVVINYHHLPDVSKESLEALDYHDMKPFFSDESKNLLGSAGGIRNVLERFKGEPFYLVNADTLCSIELKEVEKSFLESHSDSWLHMVLLDRNDLPGSYKEICFDEETKRITGTGEVKANSPFYAGVAIYHPKAFETLAKDLPLEFFTEVFQPSVEKQKVSAHLYSGEWFDIGNPELWWKTHVSFIDLLEQNQLCDRWKNRIIQFNQKRDKRSWFYSEEKVKSESTGWGSGSYWAGIGEPPEGIQIQEQAIVYGMIPGMSEYKSGIGFGGIWSDFNGN